MPTRNTPTCHACYVKLYSSQSRSIQQRCYNMKSKLNIFMSCLNFSFLLAFANVLNQQVHLLCPTCIANISVMYSLLTRTMQTFVCHYLSWNVFVHCINCKNDKSNTLCFYIRKCRYFQNFHILFFANMFHSCLQFLFTQQSRQ